MAATLYGLSVGIAAFTYEHEAYDPPDAWEGASNHVKIFHRVRGGLLYQFGADADTPEGVLYYRVRRFDTDDDQPFGSWMELTAGIAGGLVGGYAKVTDGSAQLALPDWQKLTFASAAGDVVELQGSDLLIKGAGSAGVELRGTFLHSWDSWLVFGVTVNGGPIIEFARTQIVSADPVFIVSDYRANLVAGDVVALYVSSNFEWAEFTWSKLQAICLSPAT